MKMRKKNMVWRGKTSLVLVLASVALGGWLQGFGNDTTQPVPVDPQQAAAAGAQAAQFTQLATNESMLDAVEQPFTSAVGDLDGLGAVGMGNDTLGDLGAATVLAQAADALVQAIGLGEGVRATSAAALEKPGAADGLAAPECNPLPSPACESASICTESTSEPEVVSEAEVGPPPPAFEPPCRRQGDAGTRQCPRCGPHRRADGRGRGHHHRHHGGQYLAGL